ncbi:hypothetical protein KPH14_007848 [Odynerus spinipes]|uniref:Uncharacterized protein n=1 Tax=Odynerus spinipes TaxID=1348599 RepID=A0AAD9S0E7_9HYME|nr:hypothetical protein KPH14_007848 [Odynerus spinipes]
MFTKILQSHRRVEETRQQALTREPPEISWENTLGAPNGVPFDDDTKELLKKCLDVSIPTPATFTEIIKRSSTFPINFPINTVKCLAMRERGVSAELLELNANSAYPLMHEAMLPLIARWLKHKRQYGSAIERALYKEMGLIEFIHRLLEKRAVNFFGSDDRYKLIDGKTGVDGWESVGTDYEKEPLVLTKCLSYDEIKLSAMIVVSSHTEFINDGSRENRGVVTSDPDSVQPRGVIMGVVGARFERPRVMEYQDILITPLQNNMDNGYGPNVEGTTQEKRGLRVIWANFYGEEYHPLYEETVKRIKSKDNKRYLSLTSQTVFDIENYMKRTLLSVEIILLEANTRAEKQNTTAFLHVVGFGLGAWKIIQDQEIYFLKTFEIAIRKMNKKLKYVSDVMFAYFRQQKCGNTGNGDYLGDIKIHFALREPHSKLLRATDANKLLVVTYAWDGNALPVDLQGTNFGVAISHQADRAGPTGSGQRRPSRSPRSQRSRSADVDCLRKYTERRIEGRRHTDVSDTSKLDTSRWIPLPRNVSRGQTSSSSKKPAQLSRDEDKRRYESPVNSQSDPIKWQQTSPAKISHEAEDRKRGMVPSEKEEEVKFYAKQPAARSRSTDVTSFKKEKYTEERRHTDCGDIRISSRWIPQINSARFRSDSSTFAKFTNSYEITKNAATRWITFAKNPSPFPTPRMNADKKTPAEESSRRNDESRMKENRTEATKWQPLRKFASPVPSKRHGDNVETPDSIDGNQDRTRNNDTDAIDKANRLSQRMRDLYDFKTENEWPKRLKNRPYEDTWISKSSSEDEKRPPSGRRNSQDMEFNDRSIKNKDPRSHLHQTDESKIFHSDTDEKPKRFVERHSNSEDLGIGGTAEKLRAQNRRTQSDDYDEKCRRRNYRSSRDDGQPREQQARWRAMENKRNSDASGRSQDSRGSYAEVDFSNKRNSRTSDVSYASISNPTGKRGSLECRSTQRILEMPPRRAFSQGEGRPATPVPPIEMNADRVVAVRLISDCPKRDSTRYKVYLT